MKITPSLITLFAAVPLLAESVALQPLTIASTPLHDTELNAANAVEIYTAKEIEKAHVQSLYAFINLQTSLFAIPSYGNPMAQKLDLHGYGIADGYQNIVVTVNGRRLNNVDMVPQLLSAIAPSDVQRLEIIKGGGIVLRGDGANAGTINIITKNDATQSLTFYGGLYTTYDAALRLGYSDSLLTVSASGEAYHTDGTRHIDAEQNRDTQNLRNGTFNLAVTPSDTLELRLGVQAVRTDVHYGGPMTQAEYEDDPSQPGSGYGFGPSPSHQLYDSDAYSAGLTCDITPNWTFNVDSFLEKKTSSFLTYDYTYRYDYRSLETSLHYVKDGFEFTFGGNLFDGERSSAATVSSIANKAAKQNSAGYALAQYRSADHTFKAGYRYEQVAYDYNDADNNLDRSHTLHGIEAGYNYRLSPKRSLFASYAHAYQAPDLDRFFNKDYLTGTVSFNGFIDPMISDTVTVGYTAISPANKFKLSFYYAALRDEIYYYSDPAYLTSANTNIDRSHKVGVDLLNQWQLSERVGVFINYTYVNALIDEEKQNGEDFSGNDLPGVSNHQLKAALALHPAQNVNLTLSHTYRSAAYAIDDFGNDFSQKQHPYNSTDLSLNYDRTGYTLFARITNLFDNANGLWVKDDAIYPVNFTTTAYAGATLKY